MLIGGEAGIGKTSLVCAFIGAVRDRVDVRAAGSDDLTTPRALGPLRDALGARRDATDIFTAVLQQLSGPGVDRAADRGRALGRRRDARRARLRRPADQPAPGRARGRPSATTLDPRHPLQRLLGSLATVPLTRLMLAPLSLAAVERLAEGTGADDGGRAPHHGRQPVLRHRGARVSRTTRVPDERRGRGARARRAAEPVVPRRRGAALGRPVGGRRRAARNRLLGESLPSARGRPRRPA